MNDYHGATFALLTQHGKEQVIGPLFAERWKARVQLVKSFDTDSLGTFTRDIPRDGSQLSAARKRACIAKEHSGLLFGIGSEGSFGDSAFGLYSMNLELVAPAGCRAGYRNCGTSAGARTPLACRLHDLAGA